MKKLMVITALVCVLMISCGTEGVTVQGTVLREDFDQPIAGALVYDPTMNVDSLDHPEGFYVVDITEDPQIVLTDSEGHYVLEAVARSRHYIYFAAEEHEPVKVEFRAKGRDSVYTLDVQLEPSPIEVDF